MGVPDFFTPLGNRQHLGGLAGIGDDDGHIPLGQAACLILLIVQIVGNDYPLADLEHLLTEGLRLVDGRACRKDVDLVMVLKQQHGLAQVFVPQQLHSVLYSFLVQLADVLGHPHGAVVFRKGEVKVHLALPLVEVFQLTGKVLFEVVKPRKAQLFAQAQHSGRGSVGHFGQTAGGIFCNFNAVRQNIHR